MIVFTQDEINSYFLKALNFINTEYFYNKNDFLALFYFFSGIILKCCFWQILKLPLTSKQALL